ncbi:uncharacterized protein LOC110854222 [Folsomia candida]|uniref:uncharacterized protein LOC110854222 n=1 Tax=Folsomia candida TaxID=158441 RepID=UPI000B906BF5|nr:uncharacterized protein LOC110854222 [Folsomia candida]
MSDVESENNKENNYNSHTSMYKLDISVIDENIEKCNKIFYDALMRKKRNISRDWMQMNVLVNQHLLETLSFRTMIQNPRVDDGASDKQDSYQCQDIELKQVLTQNSEID